MRSEQEMLEIIVSTAKADERIRAVILNGSRADPKAKQDQFRDFDVVYFVTDVAPFRYNYDWIDRFGERIIMQMPEDMIDPPGRKDGSFAYLMQFADGNRIDLRIFSAEQAKELCKDSLTLVLLDKDGIIGSLPPANDGNYIPRPPNSKEFSDCCNEFWWVCPYVAKGLWREEIIYAKHMLDHVLREQLMKMLVWNIGVKTGFSKNPGKLGRNFRLYFDPEQWDLLEKTYSDASIVNTWKALGALQHLFRKSASQVAGHFGFEYCEVDDRNVSAYLDRIRNAPTKQMGNEALRGDVGLRDFRESDIKMLETWAKRIGSTQYMSRYMPKGSTPDKPFVQSVLAWHVIVACEEDVGTIWLEAEVVPKEARLGIMLGDEAEMGKGTGQQAIRQIMRHARESLGLQKLHLNVREDNLRAIACYRKCGFVTVSNAVKNGAIGEEIRYFSMTCDLQNHGASGNASER